MAITAEHQLQDEGAARFRREPVGRGARVQIALDGLVGAQLVARRDRAMIERAMTTARQPLDRAIAALALAGEDRVADSLAEIFACERFRQTSALDLSPAAAVSPAFMRSARAVPFAAPGLGLCVALADPTDLSAYDGVAFALRARPAAFVASHGEIETLLARIAPRAAPAAEPGQEAGFDAEERAEADAERLRDMASAEPVVALCNRLVAEAARLGASDVHIEARERRYQVRYRIDGALIDREELAPRQALAAISRLKILSNLDIAERRRPQDGRFAFPVAGRAIDLRIASAPNVHGESVVIRLLQRDAVALDLRALGFSDEGAAKLRRLSDRPNGILLLTGPTGSGKTTTLYALLQRLAARDVKILTIEDPVEYAIEGVSQTQVNAAIGVDFASALRSFLRQDPDIIMVGEMRDLETARTAVQAALTGHLVLSTLHTNDAPSAITRLIEMGVEDYLVASTVLGVVGQRLVRRVCRACGGKAGPRALEAAVCSQCEGGGYKGRIAISEIVEVDDALKSVIRRGVAAGEIARAARARGFSSMAEDGLSKLAAGLTSRAELEKAIVL